MSRKSNLSFSLKNQIELFISFMRMFSNGTTHRKSCSVYIMKIIIILRIPWSHYRHLRFITKQCYIGYGSYPILTVCNVIGRSINNIPENKLIHLFISFNLCHKHFAANVIIFS